MISVPVGNPTNNAPLTLALCLTKAIQKQCLRCIIYMCVRVINCLRHARLASHQDVVTSAASGDGNSDNVEGQGQLYLHQFLI